jgi:hypothetical protein
VAGGFLYLRQPEDFDAEIRNGKLSYSSNAGWINWGHANPAGIRPFLDEFFRLWRNSHGAPFEITYSQQMSGNYGLLGIQSGIERTYSISSIPDEGSLERIAWGIFREVSEAFESLQGEFPCAIEARSQSSSFREGDLLGNRIGFYRALRGYTPDQVKSWLQPASVEDSLQELKRKTIGKRYQWDLPAALAANPLNEISCDREWFAKHATVIREQRSCFKLRWRQ